MKKCLKNFPSPKPPQMLQPACKTLKKCFFEHFETFKTCFSGVSTEDKKSHFLTFLGSRHGVSRGIPPPGVRIRPRPWDHPNRVKNILIFIFSSSDDCSINNLRKGGLGRQGAGLGRQGAGLGRPKNKHQFFFNRAQKLFFSPIWVYLRPIQKAA